MPPVKHPAPSPPLLLALLLLLTASVATSQDDATRPTWLDCGSASPSPSPAPAPTSGGGGTSFRANLLAILGALPHAAAPTGFASLSLGAGRDRAFVRGLCRGDSAPPQCLADLQVAVRNLSGSCSSSRRAAVWFDKAYATYADTNASTAAEKDFRAILYDVRTVADPGGYEQAYDALMSRLVARAAGGSARMFATGETQYASDDPNGTMYGLVQCMRDLRAADCDRCLQESVPQLPRCCSGHQGGVVLGYNCYLRIQIYTYYDLALDTPPPPAAGPLPPVPSPTAGRERRGKRRSRHAVIAVAVVLPLGTLLLLAFVLTGVYLQRRRSIEENTRPARMPCLRQRRSIKDDSTYVNVHLEKLTLPVLRAATGNFAAENMLGEGGFGEVFKGRLQDGQAIAVKRLSKGSSQGFHELKNELMLAAKLKHRNLVQLLGVCLEEREKLIVYEYMPNRSLDTILFDAGRRRRQALDWRKRHAIICGIARGLLYLHEESRLRIIHRDLKPSNVLLDEDMSPKISDFGLARAFWGDQSRAVTKRPAGTLGYMSPEYAYYGHVSTKSDMFSFGVIVLEIVTGRRNTCPSAEDGGNKTLLSYVWEMWQRGSVAEIVDASLGGQFARQEALACVQIGLLCVQKNPKSRPDASEVVLMLDDQPAVQQQPSRPAFYSGSTGVASSRAASGNATLDARRLMRSSDSENGVTISELQPR
ncbi:cysteine-rich receptor-like protein kinase 34 isoform X1 [Phragmites australis]|uniref:cysteine-rich receptor-like protein kinase 34 isoform X1 n=1 Tax=Phragmites australis TaxID=29695 RepID=UPI002D79086E|nr:cysteine-rich receptor-like protein kinase 34 isoform X1 [Phragmites australis]XP_062222960.1 cysteine-rich receptor-like protein kinase 34 isoform X1 [Phragmites australis]